MKQRDFHRRTRDRSFGFASVWAVAIHGCALGCLAVFPALWLTPEPRVAVVAGDESAQFLDPQGMVWAMPADARQQPAPCPSAPEFSLVPAAFPDIDPHLFMAVDMPASAERWAISVPGAGIAHAAPTVPAPGPKAHSRPRGSLPGAASRSGLSGGGSGALTSAATLAIRYAPKPAYPEKARSQGLEGLVVVEIRIGGDGRVKSVRIFRSSGVSDLDAAALSGLRAWRFVPPRDGAGNPADITVQVPVRFRLSSA